MMLRISAAARALPLALVALFSLGSTGCRKDDAEVDEPVAEGDDETLARDGADANGSETDVDVLTASLLSPTTGGDLSLASASELTSAAIRPAEIGDGARLVFFPRGCLEVTHDAAARAVTYRFDGCTGPHGLLRITGTLEAKYAVAAQTLTLDVTSDGLQVKGATMDVRSHVEVRAEGAARTMHSVVSVTGTTARGRAFSRDVDRTLSWTVGERCFSLASVAEGDIGGLRVRTEVSGLRRCQGECPQAGGKVVILDVSHGRQVEITFDGSSEARWVGPRGEGTFTLPCG